MFTPLSQKDPLAVFYPWKYFFLHADRLFIIIPYESMVIKYFLKFEKTIKP